MSCVSQDSHPSQSILRQENLATGKMRPRSGMGPSETCLQAQKYG